MGHLRYWCSIAVDGSLSPGSFRAGRMLLTVKEGQGRAFTTRVQLFETRRSAVTAAALMVFALTLLIAAGTPGPSIAALVARVMTNGLRDVLPFLAAMWIGEAI
jgi:hypothetical protein